jgi:cation:H+ antiporter
MFIAAQIILGLIILVIGGELLVRGSVNIATRFKIPKLIIGLTLVGFGTSAPELVTSINAAMANAAGIAVGNVVGSNICNILLILGLAALISPMACKWQDLKHDMAVMVGASFVLLGVCINGDLTRLGGFVLFGLLCAYLVFTVRNARAGDPHEHAEEIPDSPVHSMGLNAAFCVGGLALLILGADQLVSGAVALAEGLGVPDTVIGLTIVAIGTSLPELTASILAAIKKHADMAIGNIVGSNIFNILSILGLTAIIHPIAVPPEILHVDIWVMIAAALLLAGVSVGAGRVGRTVGGIMLVSYIGYVGYLVTHIA